MSAYLKNYSKCTNINVKHKIRKLKKKIEYLLEKNRPPRAKELISHQKPNLRNTDKSDLVKIKNFCSVKDFKRVKIQTTE